jgi:hypothetical protein
MTTIAAKNMPEPFYRQWVESRRAMAKAMLLSPVTTPESRAEARKILEGLKGQKFDGVA